jgi:hypothetical protein
MYINKETKNQNQEGQDGNPSTNDTKNQQALKDDIVSSLWEYKV